MLRIQVALAVFLLACVPVARAKDVSAQQAGVEYARQQAEKADAQHKADQQQVVESEALLEKRKNAYEEQVKKLSEDRKKAELSKKRLQEANVKYNRAQAILDQAWKE